MKPTSTPLQTLLVLTLYRLAHGGFFKVGALFAVSESLASITFNKIVCILVVTMYDDYGKLPSSQLRGFIENYEFPCFGARDGFHIYVSSKIKSYFNLKKTSSLGIVGYNKSFLYAAAGVPCSAVDGTMLNKTRLCQSILNGEILPEKAMTFESSGKYSVCDKCDSVFPRHLSLLKGYNENTTDRQQR